MDFDKYKFEVMLIVIVVVLLIFWLMINYFDNKNNNANNGNNGTYYNVESFTNSKLPSPRNTTATTEKSLNNIANKLEEANEAANTPSNTTENTTENNNNANELEKNMAVAVNNSQLTNTNTNNTNTNNSNNNVASFYSLSIDQLNSLKQQTRKHGVLGLVFFDEKTDTLRIESTKS